MISYAYTCECLDMYECRQCIPKSSPGAHYGEIGGRFRSPLLSMGGSLGWMWDIHWRCNNAIETDDDS